MGRSSTRLTTAEEQQLGFPLDTDSASAVQVGRKPARISGAIARSRQASNASARLA
jgi:hypothetical protein